MAAITQGQRNPLLNSKYVDLHAQRAMKIRPVVETPEIFSFKSTNYDLLRTVFSQLNDQDRSEFITSILARVESCGTKWYLKSGGLYYPAFKKYVCELPLIAEFCIRTGNTKRLFAALTLCKVPTIALANLMLEVEEAIALNFNFFSEAELESIPAWLLPLREIAERQTYSSKGSVGKMVENPHYVSGREDEANKILDCIDGITAQCSQALYWYLKGALQESANLEIEKDKLKVESYISSLGFSPVMLQSLNAAEEDYRVSATEFELKNSLGHLRTFYEQLHFQVGHVLADKAGRNRDDKFGQVLTTLRVLGFFTEKEEKFAAGLYGLLSVEAVHALFAKREYARLMRNMVIEYGVMFLSMMENKGIKITP
jgi:hypothetical protein